MRFLAATIALALAAVTAPSAQSPSAPVIVQMSYWAGPGKEADVLRVRLWAAEVLVKQGLPRGRVWMTTGSARATKDPVRPTVIWQGEFSDEAMLRKYEEVADKHPDFLAARKEMGTFTTKSERRYFREARWSRHRQSPRGWC
jgi:hypothetical protein